MYKFLFFMLAMFSCSVGCKPGERNGRAETRYTGKSTQDTDFISREITKDHYHAVYIEHNRASAYYQLLLNFKFNDREKKEFKESYELLKQHLPLPFKKYHLAGLPREWLPINMYRGKYYLYAPSDWGNAGRMIITDSTLIYWDMEGPRPELITEFNKTNKSTWHINARPINSHAQRSKISIFLIDPKNKIAIWEDAAAAEPYRYNMYVAKETAKNFDMIINYCKENKEGEFAFDHVDYVTLLKGR